MATPTTTSSSSPSLHITRCWDVAESHVKEAMSSRHAMGELLDAMIAVARPNEGAAKILIVLARMARPSCDWIEGTLRVEIESSTTPTTPVRPATLISVIEDLGGGVRERVFPRFTVPVSFDEFDRGLRLAPRAVEPLVIHGERDAQTGEKAEKIVLIRAKKRHTQKPPSFKLAEDCLRKSLPPTVKKTLAPTEARARSTSSPDIPITFDIPRAPKFLDLSNLMPEKSEKRGPPPVPKRPKPKP